MIALFLFLLLLQWISPNSSLLCFLHAVIVVMPFSDDLIRLRECERMRASLDANMPVPANIRERGMFSAAEKWSGGALSKCRQQQQRASCRRRWQGHEIRSYVLSDKTSGE
jgi:hypothetical protein